jgi:drug/metabolite transporter (DMT)-like permease
VEDKRKAVIYALAACLVWGTVYVAIKVGLDHGLMPLTFAGVRFLAGGLMLLAYAYAKGGLRMTWRDVWVLTVFGFFQTCIQNALFFTGVKLTNAGVSAIFINTSPFFVILMAPLWFKDSRITPLRIAGLLVGFGGVAVTSFRPGLLGAGYELGVAALVLSAVTWAGSTIAAKRIMVGRDPLMVTGAQMAFGAVPLLLTGLAVEGNGLAGSDTTGLLMLAYLILFATSLPFYAWFRALQLGEVGRISVFTFTLPVLGVLSGWLILGEPLSVGVFLGMTMVAAGIVMVNRE